MTRKGFTSRAAAAALALGLAAGAAQGAVYVGEWDPLFNAGDVRFGTTGSIYANLGWRGRIEFDVDPGCNSVITGSGFEEIAVQLTPACTAAMLSARVEFYNAALGGTPPTIASIDYTPLQLAYSEIEGLRFDDGVLTGLFYGGPEGGTAAVQASGADLQVWWQLGFSYVGSSTELFAGVSGPYTGAYLSYCTSVTDLGETEPEFYCDESAQFGSNDLDVPVLLTITPRDPGTVPVPVPGTLALGLLALGALGATRRRRG